MSERSERQWPTIPFFGLQQKKNRSKLRPWVIGFSLLIFLILIIMPPPEGLSREGFNALAVFILCIIFWVTNAIPLMITSIMAIILLPLTGVLDQKTAFSLFGNQAVFFILGAFILASAIMRSGLSTRIALMLLKYFKKNRQTLVLGVLILPASLSFVMSEHAVAAMMFPIVLEICQAMRIPHGNKYGLALFLAMSWGAIIGGIGTFLGGARAVLAVGILEENTGLTISFSQWMIAALPLVVFMLIASYLLLLFIIRKEKNTTHDAVQYLSEKVATLGKMSEKEKYLGLIMLGTVLLWVFAGQSIGLATIALGAVVISFIFKLMSWKEVQSDVNWGIFLMYGGAIALGFALNQSGAADWVVDHALYNIISTPVFLIIFICIIAVLLTEAISNSAVVALMMPIVLALAPQFNISPIVITLSLAIPCGLAFMLPMSTPATAIAISSKYVRVSDTIVTGVMLNIVAIIAFVLVAFLYWPLIGYTI